MNRTTLSPYEYLTFLIPGALILLTIVFGWNGWPHGEPGAGTILGLSVASFVVGHGVAALANLIQPVWWGHRPGSPLRSDEGLFDKGARYANSKEKVAEAFAAVAPRVTDFESRFGIAYAQAQTRPLSSKLERLVEQIGYYRATATACVLALVLTVAFNLVGRDHLPVFLWVPVFIVLAILHAYRFRRFWRYLAEYVVADVFLRLQSKDESSD